MNGCGRAIPSLGSDIRVFCERATLRTGIWGERLEIQRHGEDRASRARARSASRTVWEQFLAVRAGREPNPSPPEVGLRMARLWDAIRASSERRRRRRPARRRQRRSRHDDVRVTVWNEFRQEHTDPPVQAIYPDGIHAAIAAGLRDGRRSSRCARRPSTSRRTACPTTSWTRPTS